jgi:hypothetical protein
MRKYLLHTLLFSFLLTSFFTQAHAETKGFTKEKTPKNESAEAKIVLSRLDEIKAMDKSNLTSHEKKQLRTEVKTLKANLATLNGGVYLSVGAIIVIILLLILLL